MNAWCEVLITECGERLVEVESENRLVPSPIYLRMGYERALSRIWLREGLLTRLRHAARSLPAGLTLILWDGWRPVGLQADLYNEYRTTLAARTGLVGDELDRETSRFVSVPSEDPLKPSPHLTGGAVDLTLGDETGRELDMGGPFDELGPVSRTDFFDRRTQFGIRRALLVESLAEAGISNYPDEWWHFDFGNQFHHARAGGVARYGIARLPR